MCVLGIDLVLSSLPPPAAGRAAVHLSPTTGVRYENLCRLPAGIKFSQCSTAPAPCPRLAHSCACAVWHPCTCLHRREAPGPHMSRRGSASSSGAWSASGAAGSLLGSKAIAGGRRGASILTLVGAEYSAMPNLMRPTLKSSSFHPGATQGPARCTPASSSGRGGEPEIILDNTVWGRRVKSKIRIIK